MRPVPPAHGQLPPANGASQIPWQSLLQWKIVVPAFVLLAVIAVALGIQPAPPPSAEGSWDDPEAGSITFATPTPSPTVTPTSNETGVGTAAEAEETVVTGEVASARSTPSPEGSPEEPEAASTATATATPDPDASLRRLDTQCGELAEANFPVSVEQTLAGLAIRATNAAVYPVEYFRCILLATGGKEATELAVAIGKAERAGATHAVLVDLWLMNNGRDFAQVDLRNASFAAAGAVFPTLGVLRGKAEVVVAEGQSRGVTLIATVSSGFGSTTGPVTVSIEAPLVGGASTPGKYQLFLPTP